jgi:hypothetical protein
MSLVLIFAINHCKSDAMYPLYGGLSCDVSRNIITLGGAMLSSQLKFLGMLSTTVILGFLLNGCKPLNEPVVDESKQKAVVVDNKLLTIEAKVVPVQLPKLEYCKVDGCTKFNIQTVETNIPWINEYFIARIKKAEELAFSAEPNEPIDLVKHPNAGVSQSSTIARYISQFGNIVTFAIDSYSYSAGDAHGMHHTEYVNFDLKTKKRLSIHDIMVKGKEHEIVSKLYDANSLWLENHVIEKAKLQLSDNFYYGTNGLVFVYPLYELATYSEGISELTLPYRTASVLFKPQYLPSLPSYPSK